MAKHIDITGKRFGRLKVVRFVGVEGARRLAMWECKCDCGRYVKASGTALRTGEVKSCGCLRSQVASETIKKIAKKKEDKTEFNHEIDKDKFNDDWMFGDVMSLRRLKRMFK